MKRASATPRQGADRARGYISIAGTSYARLAAYATAHDRTITAIVTALMADLTADPQPPAAQSADARPGQTASPAIRSRP